MNAADAVLGIGEKHMKLTARQQELSGFWAFFRAEEHDDKRVDWDGRPVTSSLRGAIARESYSAPGYETISDSTPFFNRRPVAPLSIIRQIVSRFTGLLFSDRRQPRICVPGDDKTEDALNAQLEHGGFWPAMAKARNYGGAMGSSCVGFRFLQGHLHFEALDPRWVTPEFAGRGYTDPYRLTIQYTYSKEEKQPDGKFKTVWYWFRRVIDTETDTTWVPIKCREKEPVWEYMKHNVVRHGLGYVPYEWIQNLQSDDETDGDPDCLGCYGMVRAVDHLISEVYSGTINNCDPTLTLTTNDALSSIQKGSDNAIKLTQGGSAQYLELQGAGPRIGMDVAKEIREEIYRLAQCVPDWVLYQNSGEKTATEIERIFSSMFEKADALRGQYGPPMVRICQKLLQAIRQYTTLREVPQEDGSIKLIRGKIFMPPRVIQQPDGDVVEVPRMLGKGTLCKVRWPAYQRPSYTDQDTYSRVITTLLGNDPKVLTRETAMQLLAPVMDFDSIKELHALKRSEEDESASQAAAEPEEEAAPEGPAAAGNPMTWKTALDGGVITLNEYREKALGLGAIPDGDLTMPQYRSKYADVFVGATAAVSEKSVDIANGMADRNEERTQENHEMKKENHEHQKKSRERALKAGVQQPAGPPGSAPTSQSSGRPGQPQGRPSNAPGAPASGSGAPVPPKKQPGSAS